MAQPTGTRKAVFRAGVDVPLNAKGLFQAEAVARGLANESFAALYSSDLQRALQTAAPTAAFHQLPIRSDPLLRERHYGVLQSLTAKEARVRHPDASWRHARGRPLTSRRDFALPNAGLNWLEGNAEKWRVVVWADVGHIGLVLDELPR